MPQNYLTPLGGIRDGFPQEVAPELEGCVEIRWESGRSGSSGHKDIEMRSIPLCPRNYKLFSVPRT